jgi:hypothetical protein
MLAGSSKHRFTIRASAKEKVFGVWVPSRRRNGSAITDAETIDFTTGPEPDVIPPSNVAYSYPINRQRFYMQGECSAGEIVLKQGQPRLFQAPTGKRWTTKMRFTPVGGPPVLVDADYNSGSQKVGFKPPTLIGGTIYKAEVVRFETSTTANNPRMTTVVRSLRQQLDRRRVNDSISVEAEENKLTTTQANDGTLEKVLYTYNFGTSRYSTLASRVVSMRKLSQASTRTTQALWYYNNEGFDVFDVDGTTYTRLGTTYTIKPLMSVNATENSQKWHTDFVNPYIVEPARKLNSTQYLLLTLGLFRVDTKYGVSPGAYYVGYQRPTALTDAEIQSGRGTVPHTQMVVIHVQGQIAESDLEKIRTKLSPTFFLWVPLARSVRQQLYGSAIKSYEAPYSGQYNFDFEYGYSCRQNGAQIGFTWP